MKIYTKTGDEGTTSLFGGRRVAKDDFRIEAYGTVDELNSFIGLLMASFDDEKQISILTDVQNRLFAVGAALATDPDKSTPSSDIQASDIEILEIAMDNMDQILPPLRNFILPSGDLAIANAHVCRTVCRRAERRVISLNSISTVDQQIIVYLNRLSDYFFILSRYLSHTHQVAEIPWIARKS